MNNKVQCEHCNKEHDGKFGSGRFCNRSCANSRIQTKEINDKRSDTLKNKPFRKRGKLPKEHRIKIGLSNKKTWVKRRNEYIRKWKIGEVTGTNKRGNINGFIKKYIKLKYCNKCHKCGWNEINRASGSSPLEINHIDGNSQNNEEKNLELLCPNCHSLTPTYKSLNKKSMRKYKIVYR